jgi:hypothetical protein
LNAPGEATTVWGGRETLVEFLPEGTVVERGYRHWAHQRETSRDDFVMQEDSRRFEDQSDDHDPPGKAATVLELLNFFFTFTTTVHQYYLLVTAINCCVLCYHTELGMVT